MAAPGAGRRGRPIKPADVKLRAGRRLDRGSTVPLYFQLGTALRERLLTGAWAPGSRFPTEREIGAAYGVSRSVIRRALALLVSDGLIELKRGDGAFVAPPRHRVRPTGLLEVLLERPERLGVRVRSARDERPKEGVASLLELGPGKSRVTHVTSRLEIEGEPICLLDSYAPAAEVPWLLAAAKALARGGVPSSPPAGLELGRAEVGLELSFYSAWGGPQLGAAPGDPVLIGGLLQLGRASRRGKERPLEFSHLVFRTDMTQVVFELG